MAWLLFLLCSRRVSCSACLLLHNSHNQWAALYSCKSPRGWFTRMGQSWNDARWNKRSLSTFPSIHLTSDYINNVDLPMTNDFISLPNVLTSRVLPCASSIASHVFHSHSYAIHLFYIVPWRSFPVLLALLSTPSFYRLQSALTLSYSRTISSRQLHFPPLLSSTFFLFLSFKELIFLLVQLLLQSKLLVHTIHWQIVDIFLLSTIIPVVPLFSNCIGSIIYSSRLMHDGSILV